MLENVTMPMMKLGTPTKVAAARSRELLALFGLAGKERRIPSRLSGGEQQRVVIARSLANRLLVVLGDEPTGNLDTRNGNLVFAIFERLVREQGPTIVVVTHDPRLAVRTDHIICLQDGVVVDAGPAREVLARAGEVH